MLIIVIDDESTILKLAERILSRAGHDVLVAITGEDGLEIIKERASEINLVILDWSLPGLSGLEVYYEIRKISSKLPVILSSGYQLDSSHCPGDVISDVTLLEKPYLPAGMLDQVKAAVAKSSVK